MYFGDRSKRIWSDGEWHSGKTKTKTKNLGSNRKNKKADDKNIKISSITRDCQERVDG